MPEKHQEFRLVMTPSTKCSVDIMPVIKHESSHKQHLP